jgi:hypothetical protein
MTDPIARTFLAAATAYLCAGKPTDVLTHALVDAFLRLIAARSGMSATIRVGDGLITRGETDASTAKRL